MTNPILATLTDEDRYHFQSRRYGGNCMWITRLPSGKILLANGARDPVAIVASFDELRGHLNDAANKANEVAKLNNLTRTRILSKAKKRKDEDDDLDSIPIDL